MCRYGLSFLGKLVRRRRKEVRPRPATLAAFQFALRPTQGGVRVGEMAYGMILIQGTPDELRASDKPFVHQFVHGETDGPMPFHYPADDYAHDLNAMETQ